VSVAVVELVEMMWSVEVMVRPLGLSRGSQLTLEAAVDLVEVLVG
jgi:hypothetical protein